MTNKWLKVALMVTAIATGTSINIDAETVLYVPQDDRPVSLQYTVDTAREAGMTVLTPPQHLISGKTYQGQADQIMAWVEQNAGRADVMVLSTDTLIYGGLVDSRKHNIPLSTLQNRLKRIEGLKARNKNVRIYGFGEYRTIQDYPIRGRATYLHVRKRKWLDNSSNEIFSYDWDLSEFDGTRLNSEFVSFLKEGD